MFQCNFRCHHHLARGDKTMDALRKNRLSRYFHRLLTDIITPIHYEDRCICVFERPMHQHLFNIWQECVSRHFRISISLVFTYSKLFTFPKITNHNFCFISKLVGTQSFFIPSCSTKNPVIRNCCSEGYHPINQL